MHCVIFWTFLLFAANVRSTIKNPVPAFSWKQIDYAWPQSGGLSVSITPQGPGSQGSGLTSSISPPGSGIFFPPNSRAKRFAQYGSYNSHYHKRPIIGSHTSSGSETSSGSQNQQNTGSTNYVRYNNIPMGASRWKNRLFVTVPRRRDGVPSSLNYVPIDSSFGNVQENVPLIPYPSWEMNTVNGPSSNERRIVSVYRTTVDVCNRLWMVDTGLIETPDNQQRIQPAAILVFDLTTDRLIHHYEFKDSDVRSTSNLASIAVDVQPNQCGHTFAYIPDLAGYGLIVYDMRNKNSWRFTHNYFHFDPLGGNFALNELRFMWDDGIFSVALSAVHRDGFRTAYFHPMASTHEFSVSTRVLRNESNVDRSYHGEDFVHLGTKGPTGQTSMSVLDPQTGVLFLSQVNANALGCWNTNKPLTTSNVVTLYRDDRAFVYPTDVTLDDSGNVWILTNTMPYFLYSSLNETDDNFRAWRFNIRDAIAGTACDSSAGGTSGGFSETLGSGGSYGRPKRPSYK